jgi:hypothetical protein
MLGVPVSLESWYRINRAAALLLFATAMLALVQISGWRYRGVRPSLLGVCWIIAVGCVAHALIGIVQRIASLSGRLTIQYPFWEMIDRREADLQALFFNEPWFLIQGLLWMAIAWFGALHASRRRAWWFGSVFIAIAIALTMGLLSAFGRIGRFIVG